MAFCKISLERTSNNLFSLCPPVLFLLILCTFCAAQNRAFKPKLNQNSRKIESFLQKTEKFFPFFFLRSPSKVTNFNTSPMPFPPFENFSLDTLNSEQKPSVKKPVDRAGQKPIDRAGQKPDNRR